MVSSKNLMEATRDEHVELLQKLLLEDAALPDDSEFVSISESLLHKAAKAGRVTLVQKLLKHNYKLARETDEDGYRPLDIAAIMGNLEIVKELITADPEICLLKGKDQRTALHHAATKGRFMVIEELASICQDSLKDATVHGETALHLAVKRYQFDAFEALIKWLEIHSLQEIINWGDHNGNTVLHLAASTKQYECLELLLRKSNIRETLNLNAKNHNGLTAMDVFDIVLENADDLHTREILVEAGIVKAKALASNNNASQNSQPQSHHHHHHHHQNNKPDYHGLASSLDWIKYFRYQPERDSPSEVRNIILLVATIIATVSFQAGLQPPSAILANGFGFVVFLVSINVAFNGSIGILMCLTSGFPLQMELWISVYGLLVAYWSTIGMIPTPGGEQTAVSQIGQFFINISAMLPVTLVWLPGYLKNAWKKGLSKGSILPIRS